MKNILTIFKKDVLGLCKSPLTIMVVVGICLIPSLYAWFNIYSNWDPYANTKGLKIAVASTDKGYTKEDGTYENAGEELIEELKKQTTATWVPTATADEAVEGVYSGQFYAAVLINENFTSSMYNIFDADFEENPTIVYYENEKKNAVASKITDTIVSALKQNINQQLIGTVISDAFTDISETMDKLDTREKIDKVIADMETLRKNLDDYDSTIAAFSEGNKILSKTIATAQKDAEKMSEQMTTEAEKLENTGTETEKLQGSLKEYHQTMSATLRTINRSLNNMADAITEAELAGTAEATVNSIEKAVNDTVAMIKDLTGMYQTIDEIINTAYDSLTDEEKALLERLASQGEGVIAEITQMIDASGEIQDSLEKMLAELEKIENTSPGAVVAGEINKITEQITGSLITAGYSVENLQKKYNENIAPKTEEMLDTMSSSIYSITEILNKTSDLLKKSQPSFDTTQKTLSAAESSFAQIHQVIRILDARILKMEELLRNGENSGVINSFTSIISGDADEYGEYFSSLVTIKQQTIYPIDFYGSAMTPFYTVLAIWVGAIVLIAILKVKANPEGLENPKSYQLFFGRYILFFVLSQIQTAIIVLGDIYLIRSQMLNPWLFWVAAAMASFTFSLLIYALALSFGDVGKALAVVMVVIQIAGSSGTFPIELLPDLYRTIYIFFPFPYAIDAMRETIGGMYENAYIIALARLSIFAAAAVVIGLIIRIPFVGITKFMEKRMEDTKMM